MAAFANSNLGDVSPNMDGPKCSGTGLACDFLTSTCPRRVGVRLSYQDLPLRQGPVVSGAGTKWKVGWGGGGQGMGARSNGFRTHPPKDLDQESWPKKSGLSEKCILAGGG